MALTCWFLDRGVGIWSLRIGGLGSLGPVSSRFVRRVRTASGAVAVQLVVKDHGEVVEIEHVGSAHTDAELALLLAAACDRLQPGQQALELGELPRSATSRWRTTSVTRTPGFRSRR